MKRTSQVYFALYFKSTLYSPCQKIFEQLICTKASAVIIVSLETKKIRKFALDNEVPSSAMMALVRSERSGRTGPP